MEKDALFEILGEHLEKLQKTRHISRLPDGQDVSFMPFYSSISVRSEESIAIDIANGGTKIKQKRLVPANSARLRVMMGDYESGGVFDLKTGSKIMHIPLKDIMKLDFSDDGKMIALVAESGPYIFDFAEALKELE